MDCTQSNSWLCPWRNEGCSELGVLRFFGFFLKGFCVPVGKTGEGLLAVVSDEDDAGEEIECDEGGDEDAGGEGDGHGDEELGLLRAVHH